MRMDFSGLYLKVSIIGGPTYRKGGGDSTFTPGGDSTFAAGGDSTLTMGAIARSGRPPEGL